MVEEEGDGSRAAPPPTPPSSGSSAAAMSSTIEWSSSSEGVIASVVADSTVNEVLAGAGSEETSAAGSFVEGGVGGDNGSWSGSLLADSPEMRGIIYVLV